MSGLTQDRTVEPDTVKSVASENRGNYAICLFKCIQTLPEPGQSSEIQALSGARGLVAHYVDENSARGHSKVSVHDTWLATVKGHLKKMTACSGPVDGLIFRRRRFSVVFFGVLSETTKFKSDRSTFMYEIRF